MRLTVEPVCVPLRQPFYAAHGELTERELLLIGLEASDGLIGHGEAAPLPSYDGSSVKEVRDALDRCRPILAGADDVPPPQVLARCAEQVIAPSALAALDLALWDLAARRLAVPAWQLLGSGNPEPVRVNATIAAADRSTAAEAAATARAAGFDTVKVKVALGDDHGRLAAIRAFAGPDMLIRVDANGGWSPTEAQASLHALEPVGIELCEEPCAGVAAIRALAGASPVPLALDESAADEGALEARACAFMCLKLTRCGGLLGLLQTARRARAIGYEVLLASTLDGPLAIAAALHAAALLAPRQASGLATLSAFAREDPLPARAGRIALPSGPGLGDGLLGWYRS